MLIITLPILTMAYIIGLLLARILENGIIAKASSTNIQMVYVTYSTLIADQCDKVFLNNNANPKNAIDVQNKETVAVEITFCLLSSVL